MASCAECNVKMGYSETNASRNHDGLCIACYVKSLVKTKVNAANNIKKPTKAFLLKLLLNRIRATRLIKNLNKTSARFNNLNSPFLID